MHLVWVASPAAIATQFHVGPFRRCAPADKCCTEYEHCVSCCLAPQYEAGKLAPRTLKWVGMLVLVGFNGLTSDET